MLSLCIGKGYPQSRDDLYEINGQVYFGELTLHHTSGFVGFEPDKWDYILGSYVTKESMERAQT